MSVIIKLILKIVFWAGGLAALVGGFSLLVRRTTPQYLVEEDFSQDD